MRASQQTALQREFSLHVVCSWLGNSPRIDQQGYLLVTEDDFAKALGINEVDSREVNVHGPHAFHAQGILVRNSNSPTIILDGPSNLPTSVAKD
jgi:hypothetical protein